MKSEKSGGEGGEVKKSGEGAARRLGWLLLGTGTLLLLVYGAYWLVRALWLGPGLPVLVKTGASLLIFGLIILFLSVWRERLTGMRGDKYREVDR